MTNSNPGIFVCKKKAIDIIHEVESFRNLSTFEDINQLNDTCRYYREVFADKLNKTQLAVFNYLQEYSANTDLGTAGVCWKTKRNIGKDLGRTRETISRICKYLESLGIIRQYATRRENGDKRQTSDAIVIQPLPAEIKDAKNKNVTQDKSENLDISTIQKKEMSHQKNKFYSLKQNIKTYKERKAVSVSSYIPNHSKTPKQINHKAIKESDFIPHWIPESFSKFVKNFYSDSKTIKEFWIIVKQCNSVINFTTGKRIFNKEQEIHIAITAFKEFVTKLKSGVYMKKGIFAYFNGIVKNLTDRFYGDLPDEEFICI